MKQKLINYVEFIFFDQVGLEWYLELLTKLKMVPRAII